MQPYTSLGENLSKCPPTYIQLEIMFTFEWQNLLPWQPLRPAVASCLLYISPQALDVSYWTKLNESNRLGCTQCSSKRTFERRSSFGRVCTSIPSIIRVSDIHKQVKRLHLFHHL